MSAAPATRLLLAPGHVPLLLCAPQHKHIASVSGGMASTYFLIKFLIDTYGKADCEFVYCYLPNEHPDLVDFVFQTQKIFDIDIKFISKNQTPMENFLKVGFLGNSRVDPCSQNLKRKLFLEYVKKHHLPGNATVYVGIGYEEADRFIDIYANWRNSGYKCEAPLIDEPQLTREAQIDEVRRVYGWVPEMYLEGAEHNNCHKFCVKAGKKQWRQALQRYPALFDMWMAGEEVFQANYGPYTILTEGRDKKPLSLREFKRRFGGSYLSPEDVAELDETRPCVHCGAA